MIKSKLPKLIFRIKTINPNPKPLNLRHHHSLHNSTNPLKFNHITPKPTIQFTLIRHFCKLDDDEENRGLQRLFSEVESRRKARILAKDDEDGEAEEDDCLGVGSLVEKLECDFSDCDDENDQVEEQKNGELVFDSLWKLHHELLASFCGAGSLDDAYNVMKKINRFEEKHFHVLPEYRVIGELMNRFDGATGEDKYPIAQKLSRAMKLVEWNEKFNPNNPANLGIIPREEDASGDVIREKPMMKGAVDDEDKEFDDVNERDDILLEKVHSIERMLEEKVAALGYTFGTKETVLKEEIKGLAEKRNASMEDKKKRPLKGKGFDVQLIDVNRTYKVTKGGQEVQYTAILACGNYNGVVGYAKAEGPSIPLALQKAYDKCFQNLYYVDRYEDHTIARAKQTTYMNTKIYLWPGKATTGIKACKTVTTILHLAGFKNVKSKVVGSRDAHDTVKAVFQALNAVSIEDPEH